MYKVVQFRKSVHMLVKMVRHHGKRILCKLITIFKILAAILLGLFGALLYGLGGLIEKKNARKMSILRLYNDEVKNSQM